jgi:hypothetical protein
MVAPDGALRSRTLPPTIAGAIRGTAASGIARAMSLFCAPGYRMFASGGRRRRRFPANLSLESPDTV